MMNTITTTEAIKHFFHLLTRAAKGERITITKHGVPMAILGPADLVKTQSVQRVIDQIKQFRQSRHLNGVSIREMIEEGRR